VQQNDYVYGRDARGRWRVGEWSGLSLHHSLFDIGFYTEVFSPMEQSQIFRVLEC
jgi:hypothetical protein